MKISLFYQKAILSICLSILIFFAIGANHSSLFISTKPVFKMMLGLLVFALATYISLSSKILKYFHLLMLIIALCYSYIGICYGPPTAAQLLSLFETNQQEVVEFFINANYWYLLLPAAICSLLVLFVKMPIKSNENTTNKTSNAKLKKTYSTILYLICMYVYLLYPDYGFVKNSKHALADYFAYQHFIQQTTEDYHFPVSYKQNYKRNKFNVVIIGESVRQDYLSLYGYPLKTTPFLDKANGIFFNHYISASANTVPSLQLSLIVNKADLRAPISQNVVNLAKSGGYKTFWLSNQGVTGEYDSLVAKIARNSHHVISLKLGDFDSHNVDDFKLISLLEDIIQNATPDENDVIFMHMIGSHPYTCKRLNDFPHTFTISSSESVNCYLDTILKLDTFIAKTKSLLDASKENYSILYFSDHGMSIAESAIIHSNGYKQNYAVPLLIIDSDAKQRTYINENISAMNFPALFAHWLGLDVSNIANIKNIHSYQELGEKKIKVYNWHQFIEFNRLTEQAPLQ